MLDRERRSHTEGAGRHQGRRDGAGTNIDAAISALRRPEWPRYFIQRTIGTVMLSPIKVTRKAPGCPDRCS